MRKFIIVLLSITMLLAGCNNPTQPSSATSTEQSNTEANKDDIKKEPGDVVIYLTRHGKTMLNTTDRVQGWADSPLTDAGVEVAQQLGRGLKAEGIIFDAIYSSDSGRAIETAKIVSEQSGQSDNIPFTELKDIREWNFGVFEGDLNDSMVEAVTKVNNYTGEEDIRSVISLDQFADSIAEADKSGVAENASAINERAIRGLKTIATEISENGGGTVLVVAHGLTINNILQYINPEHKTVQVPNAAVAKIIYSNGEFTLETFNDVSYIEKGK